VVLETTSTDPERAQRALEMLCAAYRQPIVNWFRRRTSDSQAEDHAQDFIAYLLRKNLLARITKKSGRFRFFLFACMRFYLLDARKRQRGMTEVPLYEDEVDSKSLAVGDSQLDVDFALEIHQKVMSRLSPATELGAYIFLKDSGIGWEEVAARLQRTPAAVRKEVSRLRRRHWESFQAEVGQIATPANRAQETRYLYELLFKNLPAGAQG
jgi:DNA-directed RNA polymerase specialized sigma24 family protein